MMVKEHIVEDLGRIDHTVTAGGSGGAIQQYMTANNYPGLIDAGTPFVSYSDIVTTMMTVHDCGLLMPVFQADPVRWDPLKQMAVTGLATPVVCESWNLSFLSVLDPTTGCDPSVPADQVYDPDTNPEGIRCTVQDTQRNIWEVDPATGFARRPLDNVGVQYGLVALHAGQITIDDFIELNRRIGGFDIDLNPTAQRTETSPEVARIAFATGRVTGRGALDQTPIIDQTIPAADYVPLVDIHDQVRPQEMRARLDRTYGNHDSQAIWSGVPLPSNAIVVADRWLDRLDATRAANPGLSRAEAVAVSRPPVGDECRLGVVGIPDLCAGGVLTRTSPRQAAGGPLTEDVLTCRRQPVEAADYPASVTPAQLDEIQEIFPTGVCDWSRPGVGSTDRSQTWLSFGGPTLAPRPLVIDYPLVRSAAP